MLFHRFRKNKGWLWTKALPCEEGDVGSCEGKGHEDIEELSSADMCVSDPSVTRGAFEVITSPVTSRRFSSIMTRNSKLSSN